MALTTAQRRAKVAESKASTAPAQSVPEYGSTVTDAAGRTGVAKFDPNTGKALKPTLTTAQRRQGITTRNLAQPEAGTTQPTTTQAGVPTDNISQVGKAVSANQDIVNFDAKTGVPLAPGATTTDVLGNVSKQGSKFQQALTQLQGTGAPQDAGEGKMLARQTLSQIAPLQPDMSATDALLMEDKGWQALMQTKEEYFNPENQKTSLMDTYNKLYKKSGLDQLDEEIIDAKTIIEGTEDDIRNEIEQAGGFGSDSQVQALALSRNKVLLKNYNNLVAMRESKAEHLGTMMNLAEKDRAYADQQFDRMLNFDMQMLNFREKFVQNARDQYNKYTPQQLQAMLAGNPRQLAFAESILGVGEGGIDKLASIPPSEEEQLNLELKRSALKTDVAQRANIYKNIEKTQQDIDLANNPTGVDEKTMGKLQAAPEYKTINGVLPAMTAVKSYLDAVKSTGSNEWFSGTKAGNLKATYGNAIAAWKTLAALGALSGADFGLAENVIPEPSFFTRNSKVISQLTSAIDNAIVQGEIMTRRLSQNYPSASTLLNKQLDDMKVTAYPDKFIYSPDGEVIELTD